MALRNTSESWGWLARLLHWAMALMILFLLGVGFYMVEVLGEDSDSLMQRYELTQVQKSWGFTVFALACLRVIWRFVNPTPALPDNMGSLERTLAHGGHIALYLCMFAMPLTGWLLASSSPFNDADAYFQIKNMVFGLFELPDPYPKGDEATTKFWSRIHFYVGLALTFVLAGHALAALKHHFVNRDDVLRRMTRG